MKVIDRGGGRLGNSIFRYMAACVFQIVYGAERITSLNGGGGGDIGIVSEEMFAGWAAETLRAGAPKIRNDKTYYFSEFYQINNIYQYYRAEIIKHMKSHCDDAMPVLGAGENETEYVGNIFVAPAAAAPRAEVVFHIRLEDFITNKDVILPASIEWILQRYLGGADAVPAEAICFVGTPLRTDLERRYIAYFTEKYGIRYQSSDDLMVDFHTMMNARVLVCSLSTLSWCASFLSDVVERVYFPEKSAYPQGFVAQPRAGVEVEYYSVRKGGEDELSAAV